MENEKNSSSSNAKFQELARRWPSPLVARDQKTLDKFSGGVLNARTLANLDNLGEGPPNRVRFGRKVAYYASDLVEWMEKRSSDKAA